MGGNTTTCKRCGNISVEQNSPCSLLLSQESKGRLTHKDHTPTHSQTVMFALTEPPITTNTLGQPHTSTFSLLREYKSRSTVYTKMFKNASCVKTYTFYKDNKVYLLDVLKLAKLPAVV